jgi:hypothetical protein
MTREEKRKKEKTISIVSRRESKADRFSREGVCDPEVQPVIEADCLDKKLYAHYQSVCLLTRENKNL